MDKGPIERFDRTSSRSERPEKIRLGELLVELRIINHEQLKNVLEQHIKTGKKVGKLLIENGYITEDQLAQAIAKLYRSEYVDLKSFEINVDLVRRLPEGPSRHHRAIVLEDRRTSYLVGFADPSDLFAHDEVTRLLKREVEAATVSEGLLTQALDQSFRKADQISGLAKELEQDLGEAVATNFAGGGTADDSAVARLVSSIFEDAVRMGASDVHIEPQETKLVVRLRVDGILQPAMEAEPRIAPAVLLRLKILAGLNISEKRLPQDGRFNIMLRDAPVDVRMSTLPTQFGESAVLRILSTGGGPRRLDRIGMPPSVYERFKSAMTRSSGLVLVTGPTGSGKTTTLYSALNELNKVDTKIITIGFSMMFSDISLDGVPVPPPASRTTAVLRSAPASRTPAALQG